MSEKRFGFGGLVAAGVVAAVAGGVIAYLKNEQIKKFTAEVMEKMKPTDEEGVFAADLDDDGVPDVILADTTGDGKIDSVLIDHDGDGVADSAALDLDGDGVPDVILHGLGEDAQEADEEPSENSGEGADAE